MHRDNLIVWRVNQAWPGKTDHAQFDMSGVCVCVHVWSALIPEMTFVLFAGVRRDDMGFGETGP